MAEHTVDAEVAPVAPHAVGITVTVEASDPVAAKAVAQRALEEVVAALGFARMIS
jgi:hypothetical protein